jgi:hypothetical protein
MAILSAQRVTVPSDVLAKVIDGETVLLDLKSECYFGLDEVATRMWQVMTSSDSIEAARATLLEEYDVEPERLREDMDGLLEELVKRGLVDLVDG